MASQVTLREYKKFRKEQFKGKCEKQKENKDIATVASDGDTIIVCDNACETLHVRIPLGWLIQQRCFISLHVKIYSLLTLVTVLVGLG